MLPKNITVMLLVPISVRGYINLVRTEGLGNLIEIIHLLRSGTRHLPACSIAP
jgi:hypothetical protein